MPYKIVKTNEFLEQLTNILIYIKETFGKDESINYSYYLEDQLNNLKEFPYIGLSVNLNCLGSKYYLLFSKQNAVLYKVDNSNQQIILYTILPMKGQHLQSLLSYEK